MNEYLKPFVKECIELQRTAITIKINGQDKTFKIVPLMCVSDSVARPLLRCSNQFNGEYCVEFTNLDVNHLCNISY